MNTLLKYFFSFLLLLAAVNSLSQTSSEHLLNSTWQFRKAGETEWLSAIVPGTIHTDLLANKKIPDPFFGTNEKDLQWIESADWEYRTIFSVDEKTFNRANIQIEFDGLDTYAKVFLNDSLILSADNMFRRWNVDAKKYLKKKDNHLLIRFESAVRKGKELAKQMSYTLPGDEKVFTRKAQYQYGWDFAPRFVTCGIWRDVKIISWNEIKLIDVYAEQKYLDFFRAGINFQFTIRCDVNDIYEFSVSDNSGNETRKNLALTTGLQVVSLEMEIKNPKRWWSNGLNDANLYPFTCSVSMLNKSVDKKNISVGLRTVELVQENDLSGKSFYFKLNGFPVFMKGANWIPADNFLPRVTRERYRELLVKAKEANMNMLRVWGGGVYESDDFYSLCDSLGIMVWQDFMFACAMYPGDTAFVNNVKEEIRDNVKRLRNHPCIVMWCGNNEILEGWNNWGWQNQFHYSENDSAKIYHDYEKLFRKVIPDIVMSLDGTRTYWETSPSIGWGHSESLQQGDSHYWGVWWGIEPFENYRVKIGRFMSEYGFQGMPSLSTFKKFCEEKDLSLSSDAVKNHQKHPKGYETIQKYLERDYKQPSRDIGMESYIYVSQVMQAEGMKTAIEAHRMAKPKCKGTLYWQFNDCWPVTSWSSVDYFGNPKAIYYIAKKAYEKYFIGAQKNDSNVVVNVITDDTANVSAAFRLKVMDFTGNVFWHDSGSVDLSAEGSAAFYPLILADMLNNISEFRVFFKMELLLNGKTVSENACYFVKPKDLLLDKTEIQLSIQPAANNTYAVSFYTNSLAKNVCIDFGELKVSLSDNFFDLFPKEQKIISIVSDEPLQTLKEKIKIKSLVDSY